MDKDSCSGKISTPRGIHRGRHVHKSGFWPRPVMQQSCKAQCDLWPGAGLACVPRHAPDC
ncbi:hypothetical protein E2C01_092507 [Portunus trituberculatus]|uniref:Uncharacterized protein n=1 Tax=Portunus trituberculatus TaxID=210409 RepID=A0A5B7JS87_PORTR|nr:hypothetical protein [Portunus trituberculatus]